MIEDLLREREKSHGDYMEQSQTSQMLFNDLMASKHGKYMPAYQREALHMICVKMSRIVNGDPNNTDHWKDLAGYATLAVNCLDRE